MMRSIDPRLLRCLLPLVLAAACLPVRAQPDLSVTKTVDIEQPAPGEPVAFTVTVTNQGDEPASDVQVFDLLPEPLAIPAGTAPFPSVGSYDPLSGEWLVGALEAGQAATLVVPAIISADPAPACVVNRAGVLHALDTNPDNDLAQAALRQPGVERCADLSVSYLVARFVTDCFLPQQHEVRVRVANAGPDPARNVVVALVEEPVIGVDLGFRDAQCSSIVDGQCLIDELLPGVELDLLALSTPIDLGAARQQALTVTVTSDDADPDVLDNSETRTISLTPRQCPIIDVPVPTGAAIGCFIATAAYGSPLDPHVDTLRRFRDRVLLEYAWGRKFVALYYRYSPPMADYIAQRPWARAMARAALTPLVLAVAYPGVALVLVAGLLLALTLGWAMGPKRLALPE